MAKSKPIQLSAEDAAILGSQFKTEIDDAQSARGAYIREVQDNRELLKSKRPPANPRWEGACELTLPVSKYIINALQSRMTRAICGVTPFVNVEPLSDMWKQTAPMVEKTLQLQLTRQVAFADIADRLINGALTDGCSVAYCWWRTDWRRRTLWKQKGGVVGTARRLVKRQAQWERVEETIKTYDGPQIDVVAIEDVGAYPATGADLQDSLGAYIIGRVVGDDLLLGVEAGQYDEAAVEEMRNLSGDLEMTETPDDARREVKTGDISATDFRARRFRVVDYYRRYTDGKGPAQDWLFTIHLDSGRILRAIPSPWASGLRPFIPFRALPDKYGILGDSVIDLVGPMQEAITTLLRMIIDATALAVLPEILADPSILGEDDIKELKKMRGPGGVIPFNAALKDAFEKFSRSNFQPTAALELMPVLWQFIERATTMSDINLGRTSARTQTATEAAGQLEESEILPAAMIDRLSLSFSDLGEMIRQLDYQFADHDSVQALWRIANGDENEGFVGIEELGGEYSITAGGTTESANRTMRLAKSREVRDSTVADPLSTPAQTYAAKRDYLSELGVRNPETYIGTEEEYVESRYANDVRMMADQLINQQADQARAMLGQRAPSAGAGAPPMTGADQ